MGRPDWTLRHEVILALAELETLPNLAHPTKEERELVAWGLLRWDAGAGVKPCRTVKEYAPLEQLRVPQHRITPAGLALLGAVESLDGTAPPSEHCNPGAQKVAEGDT